MMEAELRRRLRNKIDRYFPETGPYRRDLYSKHLTFFSAGSGVRERCFMAGNRTGKTEAGAYETTCHLTGIYPTWWTGKRFSRPIKAWAAGDTSKTTREIIQEKLLGPVSDLGTGMIPGHLIVHKTMKQGTPEAVDTVYIRHSSGGTSTLVLKSYDQKRKSFQGTEQDLIWLDEECDLDIYTECLLRTMTTNGIILLTFTPLEGLSEVVLSFLPGGDPEAANGAGATKHLTMCTWDDVPHLSEQAKGDLWNSIPPYQREARAKGIPSLGSGAIYPVAEADIVIPRFEIPKHWRRGYGLDVGWNRTACVWGAQNPDTGLLVLYDEHYQGKEEPAIHAAAIKARGAWIPGVIDPAARGRSQIDGQQMIQKLLDQGLNIEPAKNAVEAGIYECWMLLSGGMCKAFDHLSNFRDEIRIYRRDEKGHVVKAKDHLMDACVSPDTLVMTSNGTRRIADLLCSTGYVLSRDGSWARFHGARRTIENAPVVALNFDDGSRVVCTGDHPFLTPSGWRKAAEMAGFRCYDGVTQCVQSSTWWSSRFRQPFRNSRGSAITDADSISSDRASGSIGRFGRPFTGARSLLAQLFTTRTATAGTTSPATSSSSGAPPTPTSTSGNTAAAYRRRPQKPLGNGINPKPAESGTLSSTSERRSLCTSGRTSFASTADGSFGPKQPGKIASVPTIAEPSIVRRLAWTTKNALAWFAAALLWRTATLRNSAARESALLRCLSVEDAGRSDVYCLTVPATSSFCLGNGAVVHNTRYLVVSGRDRMITEPANRPPEDPFGGSGFGGSWMA